MKISTPTLAALWISLLLFSGCSMNRADSLRMLDRRADYATAGAEDNDKLKSDPNPPDLKEGGLEGFGLGPVPVRTRPKVASIWIHPHEMASHDYFWGGWMSVVVEPDQWLLSNSRTMPAAPGISDVTGSDLHAPPARIPGSKPKLKSY